jgi:methionyl aminopeptidase
MQEAGRVVAEALAEVHRAVAPGVSTKELDELIRAFVVARGGSLLFFRYQGFPANACISINEEVVHGIPRERRKLKEGDIVKVDVGVKLKGYCGDAAWSFPVGRISLDAQRLLFAGREALRRGLQACRVAARVSDVARAIQAYVEAEGYSVVKKYVGHGIGRRLHEDPQVPNYVDKGFLKHDPVLQPGTVLAVEPMVNAGGDDVEKLGDGWTVVTRDRKLSVHFEHTVAVTPEGPWVLTQAEKNAFMRVLSD